VGKKPKDIKIALIPTAAEVEEDKSCLTKREEIEELGILTKNIHNLDLNHPISLEELKQYDVIFVDGGNTFYLLQKVRETEFDKTIEEYLKQDMGVYVGVSAGTIIMGPDIAFVEPWDNRNKAVLKDTKGLGYTKDAYSPHYREGEKEILDQWRLKVDYKIKELRDGEAVLIDKTGQKLI
jgi:dipeptidase E